MENPWNTDSKPILKTIRWVRSTPDRFVSVAEHAPLPVECLQTLAKLKGSNVETWRPVWWIPGWWLGTGFLVGKFSKKDTSQMNPMKYDMMTRMMTYMSGVFGSKSFPEKPIHWHCQPWIHKSVPLKYQIITIGGANPVIAQPGFICRGLTCQDASSSNIISF